MKVVFAALIVGLALVGLPGALAAEPRTLVVREGHEARLLDGAFTFQVLKLRGYSIDVALDGERRTVKRGEALVPDGADCTVTFLKISPETRIARFLTDCP